MNKVASCLIAAVAAFVVRAEQSDDWLSVSDDTAIIRTFGTRHILIFTNTASAATVTLKKAMTLDEYLLVGGGGGGGNGGGGSNYAGAGGGGGGVVHSKIPQAVAAAAELTVTVGAGGATSAGFKAGKQGGHSSLAIGGQTIYGYGGSGGAGCSESVLPAAKEGEVGSGGGGTRPLATYGEIGTEGWQWNTEQGNKGFQSSEFRVGGGGGGAGSEGDVDFGGEGLEFSISGEPVVYGSGGGGGAQINETGKGGRGGTNGGHGTVSETVRATPGKDGTGGGGGGGGYQDAAGSRGGSGTVIFVLSEAVETVSRLVVQPIEDQLLVEAAACPEVVVRDAESGEVLPASAYTVTYANNESAGHAVAVVQGAANTGYEGFTAIGPFTVHAVAYEDDNLFASDASVSNVVIGERHVYIFTNVNEKIVFRTKRMLTRDRLLLVGGGGSGGGYYGGGGGGGGYVASDTFALVEDPIEGVLKIGAGAPAHASRLSYAPGCQGGHTWLNFGTELICAYGGGGGSGLQNPTPKAAVENEIGSGGGGGETAENGFYWNKTQGHPCGRVDNGRSGGGGAGLAGSNSYGGEGVTNDITGAAVVYGSGGGGYLAKSGEESKGGTNAGSSYYFNDNIVSTSGVDGTGAGGGGGSATLYAAGGNGGSGIAVLSFLVGDRFHYRDEFILTEDRSVRRIDKQRSIVYVFTNSAATQVVQVLKQMRIKRALLVGGGGAGGALIGGGGGGGGVTNVSVRRVFDVDSEFAVRVGAGGQGSDGKQGEQGGHSTLTAEGLSLIAYGGGGGAWFYTGIPSAATVFGEIGSGGGGAYGDAGSFGAQWCYGNTGSKGTLNLGGGGGGMLTAAGSVSGDYAGHGGEGVTNSITGVEVVYGSGGGGGARLQGGGQAHMPGDGGTNAGRGGKEGKGYPGLDGTGAGGGGGGYDDSYTQFAGGNGGCGTVILEVEPVFGFMLIIR